MHHSRIPAPLLSHLPYGTDGEGADEDRQPDREEGQSNIQIAFSQTFILYSTVQHSVGDRYLCLRAFWLNFKDH